MVFGFGKKGTYVAQQLEGPMLEASKSNAQELSWQSEAREHALEGPAGFVGFTLDFISYLAASVRTVASDLNGNEIDNKYLQGSVDGLSWATSLEESIFRAVWQSMCVGEYFDVYTEYGWTICTGPELWRQNVRMPYEYVQLREGIGFAEFFLYDNNGNLLQNPRLPFDRTNPQKSAYTNPENAYRILGRPIRHISAAGTHGKDATSSMRRALPILRFYKLEIERMIKDRQGTWSKLLNMGKDDGEWMNDDELSDNDSAPEVHDFLTLKGLGNNHSGIFPMMNEKDPVVVDLVTPIDPQLVSTLQYFKDDFFDAQNMPSRALSDESGNHWSDDNEWKKLITFGVVPAVDQVLRDFTDDIWRPAITRELANNLKKIATKEMLPEDCEIPLDIIPSQVRLWPNTQDIDRPLGSMKEYLDYWKSGIISAQGLRHLTEIPEELKFELPEGVSENDLRLEGLRAPALVGPQSDPYVIHDPVPKVAAAPMALTAAITPKFIRQTVQGKSLGDKLNRIDLHTWYQLTGTITSELNTMLANASKAVIRQLTDAKTASAKSERERLKPYDAIDLFFQMNRTVVAASGGDINEVMSKHRKQMIDAVAAVLSSAGQQRDKIMGGEVIPAEKQRHQIQLAADLAASAIAAFALSDLARNQYSEDRQLKIPTDIIRDVLSAAGGATVTNNRVLKNDRGQVMMHNRPYSAGFATGPDSIVSLKQGTSYRDPVEVSYMWVHDDPDHPFEDHVDIDGAIYTDETRESVIGDNYIGDHLGDLCQELLVTSDGQGVYDGEE